MMVVNGTDNEGRNKGPTIFIRTVHTHTLLCFLSDSSHAYRAIERDLDRGVDMCIPLAVWVF